MIFVQKNKHKHLQFHIYWTHPRNIHDAGGKVSEALITPMKAMWSRLFTHLESNY